MTLQLLLSFFAESGPESLPPGSLPNAVDSAGVQESPVVDSYGQGSPEANSSVSPSGEDLNLHLVSCSTFFSEGGLSAGSLGLSCLVSCYRSSSGPEGA